MELNWVKIQNACNTFLEFPNRELKWITIPPLSYFFSWINLKGVSPIFSVTLNNQKTYLYPRWRRENNGFFLLKVTLLVDRKGLYW